jgi:antitoxin (DNA-binding transcriptional repressor) of toxin-antitoxin stability system
LGLLLIQTKEKIMQTTLAVEDIKVTLPELLDSLTPGDEVILTRNKQPVAKLVSEPAKLRLRPPPGLGKGMITIVSDDDEHLKDFAEYMP